MIILDTSGLLSALDASQTHYAVAADALRRASEPMRGDWGAIWRYCQASDSGMFKSAQATLGGGRAAPVAHHVCPGTVTASSTALVSAGTGFAALSPPQRCLRDTVR